MTEAKKSQVTLLTTEVLEQIISDVLHDRFREVEKWGIEEINGHKRKGECFFEDQPLAKAMYVIVQMVLDDILPKIEIRPKWSTSRRTL
jgi:hypothetical protein